MKPRKRTSRGLASWAAEIGTIAAFAFFLDPRTGRRRRAVAADGIRHARREAKHGLDKGVQDLRNRAHGAVVELRERFQGERATDDVIAARARARLGHVCSHPGAVELSCQKGRVHLKGPIREEEASRVVSEIGHVRGVRGVESELEPHTAADDVPGLQGGSEARQKSWSPGTRLVLGALGATLLGLGLAERRRTGGRAAALVGAAILARSTTNLDFKRMLGVGAGRRAVDVSKSMRIAAPLEEVFALWSAPENFPRFMLHVTKVTRKEDGSYHWEVEGPAGIHFRWDAVITELVPNEVIAWESRPGAAVRNAGRVRFEQSDLVETTIHVRLSYDPPAGAFGHELAKLLGADPKKQIDDDLMRLKSLLEEGKATGHETVTLDDLSGPPFPFGMH